MARQHGGEISAGVGAIVESAAEALAGSRYLHSLATESGDPQLFRVAVQLSQIARQHELAAWELASREAKSKPHTAQSEAAAWAAIGVDPPSKEPTT